MSSFRLILDSLRHHARMHAAVGLAVVAAVAVLTGALVVGDSVRASLRRLTLDRLGRIDSVLVANRFFRQELADELADHPEFSEHFRDALPLLLLRGTVENADAQRAARAGSVTLLASDERFWQLGGPPDVQPPGPGEVVLNEPMAEELHVAAGDEVVVRFRRPEGVPAESALGRKSDTVESRRLKVARIIPAEGLGRFGVQPNQQLPRNAFLHLSSLQSALDQRRRVNALVVAGHSVETPAPPKIADELDRWLKPRLEDYGLTIERVVLGKDPGRQVGARRGGAGRDDNAESAPDRGETAGYFQLTSDRLLLDRAVEEAALRAFAPYAPQPVLTYLANDIRAGEEGSASIPYSTISALHFAKQPPLGPFRSPDGQPLAPIPDGQVVLNKWAVDDLRAQGANLQPGDPVEITFFEPESGQGPPQERSVTLQFGGTVELAGPAADPHFTPEVKGVTDQASIDAWDPPFPFDASRVRSRPPNDQDEQYWDDYRATPKAFVSLRTGRELWASRFGRSTSIRVPARPGLSAGELADRLQRELAPVQLGFRFQPVKRLGLQASRGTTPFHLLFLGFSLFLIAAAVMLVALLFRLGCEQRAAEVGVMMASGLTRRRVLGLLAAEGLAVAAVAGLGGALAGIGYAWLMLAALRSPDWWLAAVSTPFLHLAVSPASLLVGYLSGVLVSLAAIVLAVRRLGKVSVRRLLAGEAAEERFNTGGRWPIARAVVWAALPSAVVVAVLATRLVGVAQAGAFFAAGGLILVALLAFVWERLRGGVTRSAVAVGAFPLVRLAGRNAARNPGRSTLTIGLVSAATFLIVAISAFRADPAQLGPDFDSGNGGFALFAESDVPLYHDLNSPAGRSELGMGQPDTRLLEQASFFPLRVQPGGDASCLNLYQTVQPRILGVPDDMIARGGFAWASTLAETPTERENPWLLLRKKLPSDDLPQVPVVLDANTATYSLKKGLGDGLLLDNGRGGKFVGRIVGLLETSIFQGDVLMAEDELLEQFPDASGWRLFLVEAPALRIGDVEQALEGSLGDFGFHAERTSQRLAGFLAVQNTYLSTFQSLGGLGLLLGTFGLATVQLRNVLERRRELALLRATGFRRASLARLVLIENAVLLLAGLGVGTLAAAVAILPHLFTRGTDVPLGYLALLLGLVLAVGLLAGLAAVRATLRAPLLAALRGD